MYQSVGGVKYNMPDPIQQNSGTGFVHALQDYSQKLLKYGNLHRLLIKAAIMSMPIVGILTIIHLKLGIAAFGIAIVLLGFGIFLIPYSTEKSSRIQSFYIVLKLIQFMSIVICGFGIWMIIHSIV